MKKKIIIFTIVSVFIVMLGGCGKKVKSEYNIDEFLDIYDDISSEYDKETEYWTQDEHLEKGNKKFIEIAKQHGFSQNSEITINGCIDKEFSSSQFICLRENEDSAAERKSASFIICQIDNPRFVLLDDYSTIKIKGTFLTEERATQLADCEILSPDLSNIEDNFKNNVDDMFFATDLDTSEQLEGTISVVCKIEDYDTSGDLKSYANYDSFSLNYEYADYIVFVDDETAEYSIPVFISENENCPLNVGDNIVVYGTPETTLKLGDSLIYWHTSYLYYAF